MNQQKAINLLYNAKASKASLRQALAFALGVQYAPEPKEKQETVFNLCKNKFFEFYEKETGLNYAFAGQEGKALKEIITKIEAMTSDAITTERTVFTFEALLQKLPDWYKKNAFSLPIINKKFNEIVSSIKINGNGKQQSGISQDYKQKLIRDLQA